MSTAKARKPTESTDLPRAVVHLLLGIIFCSLVVIAFRVSRIYVDRELAAQTRAPRLVLVNRPAWMTDLLAEQIIRWAQPSGAHSTFNRQLLADTAARLQQNPWIRQVKQVRRVYGESPGDTIEIDCEYRAPAALVRWGQTFWLVDGKGVKLPEQYSAAQLSKIMFTDDGGMNVRLIQGVTHGPSDAGKTWPGADLAGGLELANLLASQPWADEIRTIDVSNFAGRKDPREAQIVLITEYKTEIRWGRPPSAPDGFVEVSAAAKVAALEAIYQQKKRIDANQPWIDVRFDRVTCPAPVTANVQEP